MSTERGSVSAESIVAQTTHGRRAMLFSHSVRVACKVLSVLVLARLVRPAEQGLFAMAASLTLLLMIFRDGGLGAAAVQAQELSEDERTTLLWVHVGLGVVLAGMTVTLAPALVWFYSEPRLASLLLCMSASFVFVGISAWPRVLLTRNLQFSTINRIETLGALLATGSMIAAGAAGWGAYAFATFLLVSEAVIAVAAWYTCTWRPTGTPRLQHLARLFPIGFDITGHNLLFHLSSQLDLFFVGRWFGARNLGLYFRSSQVLQLPALHIATPLTQVMLASLSRLGSSAPEFREQVRSTANLILHLTLPFTTLCLVLPRETTVLILGRDWLEAAPFLRWMASNTAITTITATAYGLCIATHRTRRLAGLALISLLANVTAIMVARPFGALAVPAALFVANALLLLPRLWWITNATPVRIRDLTSALTGPFAIAGTLSIGLTLGATLAPSANELVRLSMGLLAGALAVALLCLLWSLPRRELRDVWRHRPLLPFGLAVEPGQTVP